MKNVIIFFLKSNVKRKMQKFLKIAKNLKKGSIWLHLAYFLQKIFPYFMKNPKLQYIISKYLFI